jgi:apolipoprotein N-acyltransferase
MDKRAWFLAAVSGGLQVLIFPIPDLYWLCWVAFVPLLVAILRARPAEVGVATSWGVQSRLPAGPGQAFLLGWLSGAIWYAGSCYWILYTMHVYGGLPVPAAAGVLVLFCLYLGAHTGVFTLLLALAASWGKPRTAVRRALVLAPFAWVAIELGRSRITGFAWDLLGTTQVSNIPLTRLATVTGVYGLSFEIMLVNTAFAAGFLVRRSGRHWLLGAALFAAAALQLSVFVQPPPWPADRTARLLQPDIPIEQSWSSERFQRTLAELEQNSLLDPNVPTMDASGSLLPSPAESGGAGADLIVWPESPAPFYVNDALFRSTISQMAVQAHAFAIVGAVGLKEPAGGKLEAPQILNSAALVNPDGVWIARYDKIHLVPFGEYVPFQKLFSFAHQLTREVGEFVPGTERKVFPLDHYTAGTFICYESTFPGEVRQFAARGAEVFVNISNDGWYGHTAAPFQHLNQARMRAIENRRWLLRDTNSGITAAIDPYGRVVAKAPRDVRTALTAPFAPIAGTTFYARYGDWFAWLCVIICAGSIGVGMWVFHPSKPKPGSHPSEPKSGSPGARSRKQRKGI